MMVSNLTAQPDVPRGGERGDISTCSERGEVTSITIRELPDPPAALRKDTTPVAAAERPNLPDEPRERVTTITKERPTGQKQGVTPVTTRAPACQVRGVTTITTCGRPAPLDEWRRGVTTQKDSARSWRPCLPAGAPAGGG